MKNQFKKYTQKFNIVMMALATYIITNPSVLGMIDKKYAGYFMLFAVGTTALLSAVKQPEVKK